MYRGASVHKCFLFAEFGLPMEALGKLLFLFANSALVTSTSIFLTQTGVSVFPKIIEQIKFMN